MWISQTNLVVALGVIMLLALATSETRTGGSLDICRILSREAIVAAFLRLLTRNTPRKSARRAELTFAAPPPSPLVFSKVLIWEYNIPVPIKYIAEPEMHSIPATTLHPSGGFWVGQSLDNKIVTWTARDKFRQMKKKEFKGHVNAGYACRMAFSPNGKFLASGDGQGKMFIWDWGSTKVYRKLQVRLCDWSVA